MIMLEVFLIYGGLFWLGIELMKRGIFKDWILRIIYGGVLGIVAGIVAAFYGWIAGWIALGIAIVVGDRLIGDLSEITVIAFLIAGILFGIGDWVEFVIISIVIGVFVLYITSIIALIVSGLVMEKIVKSKYKKALKLLKNRDVDNCLKYLNWALNLLKNYDYNENNKDSKPYSDMDLANKIISLKNNIKSFLEAEEHYKSKNYDKAFLLYHKVIEKNSDFKDIIGDKYEKLKKETEEKLKKQLQKASAYECEKLLEKYPMFEGMIYS